MYKSLCITRKPFLVSSNNALRDDTKNGCKGDYIRPTVIISAAVLDQHRGAARGGHRVPVAPLGAEKSIR